MFKQKTACEMRISDWSSDVCSSDLYDAGIFSSPTADMKAQRATTYEIGTRGSSGGIGWDISLYRSEIRNELQCLTLFPWAPCTTTNADRTVHQGIEVGLDATIPLSARSEESRVGKECVSPF